MQPQRVDEDIKIEKVRLGEIPLRLMVVKKVTPEFPDKALKAKVQGVTVVELEIDIKGEVSKVLILESPSEDLGQAVSDAVRKWTFKPQTVKGSPVKVVGKLTFYFVVDKKNKGYVLSPEEMSAWETKR